MPLAGERLTFKWALALCSYAGFPDDSLPIAVSVICAESGRYVEAWHDNLDLDGNVVSIDRGLFQINSVHDASLSPDDAFKAIPNAKFARTLSHGGTKWTAWSAFNSGAYENFFAYTAETYRAGVWRSRVQRVAVELA